jgi:transposase-like protein
MANIKQPRSLQEAIAYFADPERAFVYAVNLRWPDRKIACPRCGGEEHSFLRTRLMWFCKGCKKQFSVKVGSIFEDSPLGMDKWMTAFWMVVNCKNGVSSAEMARTLKITQKSAWFMLHRVREVLKLNSVTKLGGTGGPVESETRPLLVQTHRRCTKNGASNWLLFAVNTDAGICTSERLP